MCKRTHYFFIFLRFSSRRPLRNVRHVAAVPGDDRGRRERLQGPGAQLRKHPEAGHRPPPAQGLRLSPHPLAVDPGTVL